MPKKHAAGKKKSLQEGNPALKKLIVIQKVRDFQTPVPTLATSLRLLFLLGVFYKVSSLCGRDDVFGKHGLTEHLPFGLCALML